MKTTIEKLIEKGILVICDEDEDIIFYAVKDKTVILTDRGTVRSAEVEDGRYTIELLHGEPLGTFTSKEEFEIYLYKEVFEF